MFTLNKNDVQTLLTNNPDCTFVFWNPACENAGLTEAITSYKDETELGKKLEKEGKSRAWMFAQSKAAGFNQETRLSGTTGINGAPVPFSTYYTVFYKHFNDMKKPDGSPMYTDGEVHLKADLKAREYVVCDAEVARTGVKGGVSTRGLQQPE